MKVKISTPKDLRRKGEKEKEPRETGLPLFTRTQTRRLTAPFAHRLDMGTSGANFLECKAQRCPPLCSRQNELEMFGTKICASETEAEEKPRAEAWSCVLENMCKEMSHKSLCGEWLGVESETPWLFDLVW